MDRKNKLELLVCMLRVFTSQMLDYIYSTVLKLCGKTLDNDSNLEMTYNTKVTPISHAIINLKL